MYAGQWEPRETSLIADLPDDSLVLDVGAHLGSVHAYVHMCLSMYVYVELCTCIYIHTHTYIYIYTYTDILLYVYRYIVS